MKKLKYIILLLCPFFIFIKVNACTPQDKIELRGYANNIKFDYDVYKENNVLLIYFTLYNLNEFFYVKENQYNTIFNYNKIPTVTIRNFKDAVTYNFTIYGSEQSKCPNEEILDKYISVPKYNPYYENKLCEDVKEFILCGKYNALNIKEDEFIRRINEYKKSLEDKKDNSPIKKDKNKVLEFLMNYWLYFVLGGLGISIMIGVIFNVKWKK